jgi:hypothetical protein
VLYLVAIRLRFSTARVTRRSSRPLTLVSLNVSAVNAVIAVIFHYLSTLFKNNGFLNLTIYNPNLRILAK